MDHPRALTIDDLLSRVNLMVDFNEACATIAQDYSLGALQSVDPLLVGHEGRARRHGGNV